MNKIQFAKVSPNAIIPSREEDNAGLDVYCCFQEDYMIVKSSETRLIPTGIASIIPKNYYIQIQERGSTGSKGVKYSAGVIDSSYRGEWFLALTNTNKKDLLIIKKEILSGINDIAKKIIEENYIIYPYEKALFQGILHKVHNAITTTEISLKELNKDTTKRGSGKLGSSGK